MEINKSVSNPMLIGAIELLKADPSTEHKNMFVNEMMKAKFLTPAMVTPAPEPDENGRIRLTKDHKIQFPVLTAKDGKTYFMAYSDKLELDKWPQTEGVVIVSLMMEEFMAMTLRKESASSGCVINPFGANIIVPREMMASMMAARIAKMQEAARQGKMPQKPPVGPKS